MAVLLLFTAQKRLKHGTNLLIWLPGRLLELKQQIEIHNDKYLNMKESKRASEKREEDQRAINRELELRLRKIRELLG